MNERTVNEIMINTFNTRITETAVKIIRVKDRIQFGLGGKNAINNSPKKKLVSVMQHGALKMFPNGRERVRG